MTNKVRRRDLLMGTVGGAIAAHAQPRALETALTVDRAPAEEPLRDHPVTHGGLQRVWDPFLEREIIGQTCIKYLRFARPVLLDRLTLPRIDYGRGQPNVPTHPAHLVLSLLDGDSMTWKTVREVDLPADPHIAGKGMSQGMSMEEMEAVMRQAQNGPPLVIEAAGIRTDHIRVVCDREHPVWPNHGECNGGTHNVPFGILRELKAFGRVQDEEPGGRRHNLLLRTGAIHPAAPSGMEVSRMSDQVLFQSKYLSIGFSLRRPMILRLGWDSLGRGAASNRILAFRRHNSLTMLGGLSGPLVRTIHADYPCHQWTGEVSVRGNKVEYRDLRAFEGLKIDAIFTVHRDRILFELTQTCDRDLPAIEAEAWRFVWDLTLGSTGMAAVPTQLPGRNGDVTLPGLWAGDGNGCLSLRQTAGHPEAARFQVESYRFENCLSGGVVLGRHPGPQGCLAIPSGTRTASFEITLDNLEPRGTGRRATASTGLKRHWGTVFSCFRPEYRGFSNNSASVNCHVNQGPPSEIAALSRPPEYGPRPLDLARFTIGKALMNGGGYGYHRNLYLDSDPNLVSAAGRIHQAGPDMAWLREIEPGLKAALTRIIGNIGDQGLVICRDLSGNSGSYRWSSNAMDVVGFGHIDAYVNAWAFRGLRNGAALMAELPEGRDLAARCREAAGGIRASYGPALLNPETGWVAGWRSRDGKLHDYAFLWVNGVAAAFGLLDDENAREALLRLEKKRDEAAPPDARFGLPCNLLPIRKEDHMLPRILGEMMPTFETYTDGSISGFAATYYLRALRIHGLGDRAAKVARELSEGYSAGHLTGGIGSGSEFRSWEGLPTGYEGTLIVSLGPLYAIAIEEGLLAPPEPEWWPANG